MFLLFCDVSLESFITLGTISRQGWMRNVNAEGNEFFEFFI